MQWRTMHDLNYRGSATNTHGLDIGLWTWKMVKPPKNNARATMPVLAPMELCCVVFWLQCNGAAAAMMLNESVELRLSWKLGRETVGCGLAGCATNTFKKIGEIKRIGESRPISQFWWKQGKSQRYQNQLIVKEGKLKCNLLLLKCSRLLCWHFFLNCFGAKFHLIFTVKWEQQEPKLDYDSTTKRHRWQMAVVV